MFPVMIRTKCQKVTQGVYLRYCSTIWKFRDRLTMSNVRMFPIPAYVTGLFNISLKKDQSGVPGNGVPKGLPMLPFRDQRTFCLIRNYPTLTKKFTGHTSFANCIGFTMPTIWTNVARGNLALLKLFVIKGSCTRFITKLCFLSKMDTFNDRNNRHTIQAMIRGFIVQFFCTFKTNFIGGCTTEPMRFNGKHSFSFRYANAYGRILSKITLIAGCVNETFKMKDRGLAQE